MSCSIGRADLCFRHGDTRDAWSMQFIDANQEIVPLAGHEFFMEIRQKDTRVHLFKIGEGLSIESDKLVIEKNAKEDLGPGTYDYALKMKEPDGDLYTYLQGKINVEKELVDEDA